VAASRDTPKRPPRGSVARDAARNAAQGAAQGAARRPADPSADRPRSAHARALDELGLDIVAGRFAAGAPMPPEPLLCERLGVSRTVVREAVKSLAAKGLLVTGPKLGTRVLPEARWNWFDADVLRWRGRAGMTRDFLRELQELRRLIEPAAARLAAERATAEDVRALDEAYAGMREAVERGGDYATHDQRFLQALLRASGNRLLAQAGRALEALLRTSFELAAARPDGAAGALPLHRAVLDAVIQRSPAKAENASELLNEPARQDNAAAIAPRRRQPARDAPARRLRPAPASVDEPAS
jgi:DNA-binding FadR family transcriptional regulator